MHTHKGIAPVLWVIIAAVVLGGGYVVYQTYNQQLTTDNGGISEAQDTKDWNTYRNEKYGFEFKYSIAREGFGVYSNDFNTEAPVASAISVANPDVDNPNRNPLFNVRVQGGEQRSVKSFAERVRAENIQDSVLAKMDIGGKVAYAFTVPAGYFVVHGTTILLFSPHTIAFTNVLNRIVAVIYFPDDQRSRSILSTFRFMK